MDGGLIEFRTGEMNTIGSQTLGSQSEWDAIWERCRSRISATASEALDQATGSSLEERNADYHRRSATYSGNVGTQGQVMNQMSSHATDVNAGMVRAMSRGV